MSRPKKADTEDKVQTSMNIERVILDDVKRLGIPLRDVFVKGYMVIIPNGMTGAELRKKQIRRRIRSLEDEKEEIEEKISLFNNEMDSLEEVIIEVSKEKVNRKDELIQLWPEFRKKVKGNPTWIEGDPEIHVWWEVRGVTISYGELVTVWDEMEALNG